MPTTKVIKSNPVEATRKPAERTGPVKGRTGPGAQSRLTVPAVRKSRASSCPRCPTPQWERCEGRTGARSTARRSRSTSTAPKTTVVRSRTNPDCGRATVNPKNRDVRPETRHASQSHKAFTVIPPNPKKRREIQRKAEAELAALEELRLSRAMAFVSIDPSSVGGCLSLEEVRLKQQQEMMQAKRKPKPMKKQVLEQTAVLRC
ncbi:uncharacterized protein zgc:194621 [Centropristis striata]|uniref:uncharacterized protein zgc:194621 n=1 Tax=Centropristis striata TaxID=184440 RepID=UPI0027E03953|nr:uncharacterized protein zgc:194621 [Centropristis striata]